MEKFSKRKILPFTLKQNFWEKIIIFFLPFFLGQLVFKIVYTFTVFCVL